MKPLFANLFGPPGTGKPRRDGRVRVYWGGRRHHRNGLVSDDRPENLEVSNQSDHARRHNLAGRKRVRACRVPFGADRGPNRPLGYTKKEAQVAEALIY